MTRRVAWLLALAGIAGWALLFWALQARTHGGADVYVYTSTLNAAGGALDGGSDATVSQSPHYPLDAASGGEEFDWGQDL